MDLERRRVEESSPEWWCHTWVPRTLTKQATWSSLREEARIQRAPTHNQTTTSTRISAHQSHTPGLTNVSPLRSCLFYIIFILPTQNLVTYWYIYVECRAKKIYLSDEKVTRNPVCSTLSVSKVSMEPPSESPTFTTRSHPAGWETSLILVLSEQKHQCLGSRRITRVCHRVFDTVCLWFFIKEAPRCFWKY